MPEPHPSVAAARLAVRVALRDTAEGALVHAAVSGGADSLALLAALAFETPRQGRRLGVIHVDHGLQPGSAAQAQRVVAQAAGLGVDDVQVVRPPAGPGGADGPEAAARRLRYAVFDEVRSRSGAEHLYLGHTLDDQAEQVLLGLVRGSGTRSLAGMPAVRGCFRRPLLHLTHQSLVEVCRQQRLEPWQDPSNDDLAMTRNRVRRRVLPVLETELGPGIAAALARTASLARSDADLLDALAEESWRRCATTSPDGAPVLSVPALGQEPEALRTRVVRRFVLDRGAPAGALTHAHVTAVCALVAGWHGQRGVSLPGGLVAVRRCDTLAVETP